MRRVGARIVFRTLPGEFQNFLRISAQTGREPDSSKVTAAVWTATHSSVGGITGVEVAGKLAGLKGKTRHAPKNPSKPVRLRPAVMSGPVLRVAPGGEALAGLDRSQSSTRGAVSRLPPVPFRCDGGAGGFS